MKEYIKEFLASLALDTEISTEQFTEIRKVILEVLNYEVIRDNK